MAYIRRRKSGRWEAAVTLRGFGRVTRGGFTRRREAEQWADANNQAQRAGCPAVMLPPSRQAGYAAWRILALADGSLAGCAHRHCQAAGGEAHE